MFDAALDRLEALGASVAALLPGLAVGLLVFGLGLLAARAVRAACAAPRPSRSIGRLGGGARPHRRRRRHATGVPGRRFRRLSLRLTPPTCSPARHRRRGDRLRLPRHPAEPLGGHPDPVHPPLPHRRPGGAPAATRARWRTSRSAPPPSAPTTTAASVIPNTALFTDTVLVNTAFEKRRLSVRVCIGNGDDIARAKRVIVRPRRAARKACWPTRRRGRWWPGWAPARYCSTCSSGSTRPSAARPSKPRPRAGGGEAGADRSGHRHPRSHHAGAVARPDGGDRRRPRPPARGLARPRRRAAATLAGGAGARRGRRPRPRLGGAMKARLREWLEALGDAFWLRPALVVAGCVLLGEAAVWAERAGWKAAWLPEGWLYAGGEAGARSCSARSPPPRSASPARPSPSPWRPCPWPRARWGRGCCGTSCATRATSSRSASSWAPSPTPSWCCAPCARSRRGRSCRTWASPARWRWRCSASGRWSGSCTTSPRASTSRR